MHITTQKEPLSGERVWGSSEMAHPETPPCPLKTESGQCPEGCHLCRHWPEPFEPTF